MTTAPRTWMILHAGVTMGLPLLIALFVSCIKAPELKPPELGPQATDADLERVISKALYGVDPWTAEVGQQVVYDFNVRIEDQEQVQPITRLTQTVMKKEVLPEKLRLHLQNHELDLNDGRVERSEPPIMEFGTSAAAKLDVFKQSAVSLANPRRLDSRPVKKITYHNLRESSGLMDPPAAVRARPGCGGVVNCQLRFYQVNYDEALWYSETEYEVQKWRFVISRDAPFLGYIFERCLASLEPGADRRYLINQCQITRDFHYSGATAP